MVIRNTGPLSLDDIVDEFSPNRPKPHFFPDDYRRGGEYVPSIPQNAAIPTADTRITIGSNIWEITAYKNNQYFGSDAFGRGQVTVHVIDFNFKTTGQSFQLDAANTAAEGFVYRESVERLYVLDNSGPRSIFIYNVSDLDNVTMVERVVPKVRENLNLFSGFVTNIVDTGEAFVITQGVSSYAVLNYDFTPRTGLVSFQGEDFVSLAWDNDKLYNLYLDGQNHRLQTLTLTGTTFAVDAGSDRSLDIPKTGNSYRLLVENGRPWLLFDGNIQLAGGNPMSFDDFYGTTVINDLQIRVTARDFRYYGDFEVPAGFASASLEGILPEFPDVRLNSDIEFRYAPTSQTSIDSPGPAIVRVLGAELVGSDAPAYNLLADQIEATIEVTGQEYLMTAGREGVGDGIFFRGYGSGRRFDRGSVLDIGSIEPNNRYSNVLIDYISKSGPRDGRSTSDIFVGFTDRPDDVPVWLTINGVTYRLIELGVSSQSNSGTFRYRAEVGTFNFNEDATYEIIIS